MVIITTLLFYSGNIKSGVKIFNVTGDLTISSLGGTEMKSVTKTYTIAEYEYTSLGLTNEQLAGLHSVYISSAPSGYGDSLGWFYTGDHTSSYIGDSYGIQVIINGDNRGTIRCHGNGAGTVKATFYYFA